MKELELYIHVPFCVRKCAYCDFLSAPASEEEMRGYFDALKKEMIRFPLSFADPADYTVRSVFFGGGTPSIVPAAWIRELLETLTERFAFSVSEPGKNGEIPEITLECNPGTVTAESLVSYRDMGINRLSIGAQSADERELRLLGRIHSWEQVAEGVHSARAAGFHNLNIDLMSGLPGQTCRSWENTLCRALELKPEHISAYSLIVEEGTPFWDLYAEDLHRRERGEAPELLPSEETEREMVHRTSEILSAAGFRQYELSNYSLPGYSCIHNRGYWQGTEYIGFGLGAASFLAGVRWKNTENMDTYQSEWKNPEKKLPDGIRPDFRTWLENTSRSEISILSRKDRIEEFMFLGLRMEEGISLSEFQKKFSASLFDVYGHLPEKLAANGLLYRTDDRLALTEKGKDLASLVMAEFLFD